MIVNCYQSVAVNDAETAADTTYARSSGYGGNDYVDYGAYTGGYGAFGW